jgi:aryl-phospho-beta-D-glucosidase BglC (GH1 family)
MVRISPGESTCKSAETNRCRGVLTRLHYVVVDGLYWRYVIIWRTPANALNTVASKPWITPSIFQNTNNTAIVDEYTFGQMQDPTVALNVLNDHWNTWITEDDFQAISAAGLSHVRYVQAEFVPI